jgi:hypothetical protein
MAPYDIITGKPLGVNGATISTPSLKEGLEWIMGKAGVDNVSVKAAQFHPMTDAQHKSIQQGAADAALVTNKVVPGVPDTSKAIAQGIATQNKLTTVAQPDTGTKVYPPGSQTPSALIQNKLNPPQVAGQPPKVKPTPQVAGQPAIPQKVPQSFAEAADKQKTAVTALVDKATTGNPQNSTLKAPAIVDQIKSWASAPTTPPRAATTALAMIPDIQAWNGLPLTAVQQRLEAFPIQSLNSKNTDQALEAQTQASVMQLIRNQVDNSMSSSSNPEIRDQFKSLKDFHKVLSSISQEPVNVPNIITNQPLEIPVSQLKLSNEPNQVLAEMYQQAYQSQQQKLPESPRMVMGAMLPQQPPTPFPVPGQPAPGQTPPPAPLGSNERAIADAKQTYDDYMANNQLINQLKQRGKSLTLGNILPIRRRKLS